MKKPKVGQIIFDSIQYQKDVDAIDNKPAWTYEYVWLWKRLNLKTIKFQIRAPACPKNPKKGILFSCGEEVLKLNVPEEEALRVAKELAKRRGTFVLFQSDFDKSSPITISKAAQAIIGANLCEALKELDKIAVSTVQAWRYANLAPDSCRMAA